MINFRIYTRILKMALNAINGIASGVVANKKTPLVAQGLALLSFKLMKFFRIKVIGTINS